MLTLFRNRLILTILTSALFLQIGIWVRNYSVLFYVMDKTHQNATAISMISVAEFAPIFLFSFIGGTFADRWRPKRTMVWCDFLSAISIMGVLLTLSFGSWRVVFFATLVSSILSQFSQPSGMRLFKVHVHGELMQAGMSIYQTLFAMFMIIGPMLGTFVYQHYGIKVAIGIMGVAFLLSAGVLTFLPKDEVVKKETVQMASVRSEMVQGFRYVLHRRLLASLGGCFLVAGLALGFIQPLGIFIVTERLGLSKDYLQWFMAANGVAMIIGGVLAMAFSKRLLPQWLLMLGMVASVFTIAVMGLSTHLWLSLIAQFFSGLFMPGLQIGIQTLIMDHTEESFIGRVNGSLNPLFMGGMVITMSLAGWFKTMTSLSVVYLIAAGLFVIGAAIMLPIMRTPRPPTASDALVSNTSDVRLT
jgi:MFS transporter, DHA3 family, macrolide efflux protein